MQTPSGKMNFTPAYEYYPSYDVNPRPLDAGIQRRYSKGWPTSSGPQTPTGLRLSGMKYDEVKAKCLKEGKLFEDPDFDAVDSNLYYKKQPERPSDRYVWKRPKDILRGSGSPQFLVDAASPFDLKKNILGDNWILAAMACISSQPDLMRKVIPDGQSFKDGDYAGIFRFNFWKFGKWVEVIIDDRLPTNEKGLVYTGPSQLNEFWTALLEKAFAKLYGSYQAIHRGYDIEAMEDLTGGIGELWRLGPDAPSNLWSLMTKDYGMGSLMCCSIKRDKTTPGSHLPNGLIMGRAYIVTGVKLVNSQQFGDLQMVRLRNPWRDENRWIGDWSENSSNWSKVSKSEKEKIWSKLYDGEFWMSFDEFVKNFDLLNVCHLDPESYAPDEAVVPKRKRWAKTCLKGCWIRGTSAGGDVSSPNFWTNPQCGFEVVDVDEGDSKDPVTVIIALMQRDRTEKRAEIGYAIYQLQNPLSAPLDKNFDPFHFINKPLKVSDSREICDRYELRPGNYCVVSFTKVTNQKGDFILRLFAEKPVNSIELDEHTGKRDLHSPVKLIHEDSGTSEQMLEAFKKIAREDLEIDAYELKEFLNAAFKNEFKFDGFSSETCRSLVALKDVDRSGKLGYSEFLTLWFLLQKWKKAFKNHDADGNGTFDSFELRQSLRDMGYSVSNQTFNALVRRYSHKDGKIYFDDFIHCIARLSTMFEVFDEMNHGRGDTNALFNRDQFIQTTMYS